MESGSGKVLSPLSNGPTRLIGQLSTAQIIDGYHKTFAIDVSKYFEGIQFITIHECIQSGFRFYHPFDLAGLSDLYEQLEAFEWNYKENKWEFTIGLEYIKQHAKILDVGSGEGAFVQLCSNKGMKATGLELNSVAVSVGRSKGRDVHVETLGDHARNNESAYDVVTSFQVLEHISDPKTFLSDCATALRDGGTLIIGVPNNDTFLKHDRNAVLNMPPHHMGLWTKKSLKSIGDFFPLELVALREEPLAEIDWFVSVQVQRFLRSKLLQRIYYRTKGDLLFRKLIEHLAPRIRGHTILAVYKKVVQP